MSKAQQAAEERWPESEDFDPTRIRLGRVAFLEGVAWALPENPDPAVIEAMERAVAEHEEVYDETLDRLVCSCGDNYTEGVMSGHIALAVYAAQRGAMQ